MSTPRPPRRRLAHAAAAALAAAAFATPGCVGAALLHEAVHGPAPTPAAFTLPDRVTAVLVDDPQSTLRAPRLPRRVAAVAVHNLRFHEALPTAVLVDPDAIARLESRLGDSWNRTPIDEIGRRLQAQQVVYAVITAAGSTANTLDDGVVPALQLDVKVIDTATGTRTWPPDRGGGSAAPGHRVVIKADIAQRRRRLSGRDTPRDTLNQLADQAGLTLAQLFYDWQALPPGNFEK